MFCIFMKFLCSNFRVITDDLYGVGKLWYLIYSSANSTLSVLLCLITPHNDNINVNIRMITGAMMTGP